jgi:hypothetical protein
MQCNAMHSSVKVQTAMQVGAHIHKVFGVGGGALGLLQPARAVGVPGVVEPLGQLLLVSCGRDCLLHHVDTPMTTGD